MGVCIAAFSFLPLLPADRQQRHRGHLYLAGLAARRCRSTLAGAVIALCFGLLLLMWRMWAGMLDQKEYDYTTAILQIPHWLAFVPILFSLALLAHGCGDQHPGAQRRIPAGLGGWSPYSSAWRACLPSPPDRNAHPHRLLDDPGGRDRRHHSQRPGDLHEPVEDPRLWPVLDLRPLGGADVRPDGQSGDPLRPVARPVPRRQCLAGTARGGVAMATIAACAGFGSVCGSSLATASTMGQVALPELRR